MKMMFKGNSTRLELLIEKIQSNKEITDEKFVKKETSRMDENPYECSICYKKFPRSSVLDDHLQTHTDQLQFTCSYCPRLFKHKRSRDRHTKLHTGDKKYKCTQCDSAFSRSDHLKIHMKTHDSRKPYKCGTCNRGYNTAAALSSHQQSHLKLESRQSSSCRNSRASTPSPGMFRCPQCMDSFSKNELLQNHLASAHKEEETSTSSTKTPDHTINNEYSAEQMKIVCMYCSKEFPSFEIMYQHICISHRDFQNGVSSSLISPSSGTRISPKTENYHNGTPLYACDKCMMQFDSSQNLKEHVSLVHIRPMLGDSTDFGLNFSKDNSEKYPNFQSQPTDLSQKKEKYEVEAKRKKTDTPSPKSPFETNSKPYICSCCYAQLPNFKSFRVHMETHVASSNNTFLGYCPFCGEPGRDSVSFTNHIFGHAIAQVPGTCCYLCLKSFESSEELQKHYVDVHVVPVFKCTICSEIFDTKLSMQMHFSNKHNDECNHFKCYLCTNQIFHDRLSAELHISMKHHNQFLPSALGSANHLMIKAHQYSLEFDSRVREFGLLFQCSICHEQFKDQYSQFNHILEKHADNKEVDESYTVDRLKHSSSVSNFLFMKDNPNYQKSFDLKGSKTYSCDICSVSNLLTESELITHKKYHHGKSKARSVSLQCAYCNEFCKSRNDLENHMKSHQVSCSKGKHKCNICDEVFSSGLILADHKLTHCKIVEGNNCVQCKAVLTDEQSFYSHQLQHSIGPVKPNSPIALPANCVICCQTLQSNLEIKLHSNFHLKHLSKEFICKICNKIYERSNKKIVDNYSDTSFVGLCNDCSSQNQNNGVLYMQNQHIRKETTYMENIYTENGNEKSILKNELTNLECRLCKQVLSSPSKLQVHLIEHNFYGMNQYSCYVCSSVFTAASGLQTHIVGHGLQSRPYECNHCQMKFFFRTELDNHRFIHLKSPLPKSDTPKSLSNDSEYDNRNSPQYKTCQYCSSSFLNNSFFIEHLTQCPFKLEIKKECPDTNIDNNIKQEVVELLETKNDQQ